MGPRSNTHYVLIDTLKALGCKSNEGGICHGIAYMGMQAMLSGEEGLNTFNERINFITKMAAEALQKLQIEPTAEERSAVHTQLYKDHYDEKFAAWNMRAESVGGFTKLFSTLSEDEKKEWDLLKSVEVFSQGIDLYFNPERFADDKNFKAIFSGNNQPTNANADVVMPFLYPTNLDKSGGIDLVKVGDTDCRTCRYFGSNMELSKYLSSVMQDLTGKVNQMVSFTLTSGDHTISIGFNPVKQSYLFLDSNSLPVNETKASIMLAARISKAFLPDDATSAAPRIFTMSAYASTNDLEVKKNIIKAFDQPLVIPESAVVNGGNRDERNGLSYLDLAAAHGHPKVVAQILKKIPPEELHQVLNESVNPQDYTTVLLYAMNQLLAKTPEQTKQIVELLLKHGANPNMPDFEGATALHQASKKNNNKIILETLLKYGADPNIADQSGFTAIHHAMNRKDMAAIKILLEYGTLFDSSQEKEFLTAVKESIHSEDALRNFEKLLNETKPSIKKINASQIRALTTKLSDPNISSQEIANIKNQINNLQTELTILKEKSSQSIPPKPSESIQKTEQTIKNKDPNKEPLAPLPSTTTSNKNTSSTHEGYKVINNDKREGDLMRHIEDKLMQLNEKILKNKNSFNDETQYKNFSSSFKELSAQFSELENMSDIKKQNLAAREFSKKISQHDTDLNKVLSSNKIANKFQP